MAAPVGKRIELTPEQAAARRRRLIAAHEAGVSPTDLARTYHMNQKTVREIIASEGIEPRQGMRSWA